MRIIDADALIERICESCSDSNWYYESLVEEAPTVGLWVSVKERLPEKEEAHVVVWFEDGSWGEAVYAQDKESFFGIEGNEVYRVTHWMELEAPDSATERMEGQE